MKRNIIIGISASLLLLSSCDYNEDNFPGFDESTNVTDVQNIKLTLADNDYLAIASNEANLEIALAKDPEGKTGVAALEAVGKNKYFTADAAAEDYLPQYIASKYPYVDITSKFAVTYKQYQAPSNYLADFTNISTYQLSSEDYKTVWGDKVKASYLSPASVGKIPSILSTNLAEAAEGDMVVVNYAYSDVEPSIGGGSSAEPTWTEVSSIPVRATGANWNFVNVGPIDLSEYKGQTVNIGFRYTSTASGAATWELKNFKALAVPYLDVCFFAKQEDGSFKKLTKISEFAGAGEYVIATMGVDGNYYPFGRLADGKTYGYMYPKPIVVAKGVIAATDAADFVITVAATDAGFTMKNVLGQYLYMSGKYNSFNVTEEVGANGYDWTITSAGGSDLFTITNVEKGKTVKLNYYNGSYSYGSYPANTIEGNIYAENSLLGDEGGFTVYDINTDGLSFIWKNTKDYGWKATAYVNKVNHATESYLVSPAFEITADAALPYITIDEAFRFGAGAKDLSVWVSTDYDGAGVKTKAMTRASDVPANASVLYRFNGTEWSVYTNEDAKVTVVDPQIYASLGTTSISEPDFVLPTYLNQKYPYASLGERAAVVYNKSADQPVVVEYEKSAGGWIVTPKAIEENITLTKDKEGITAKISVYMNETLLGNDGGFVAQDVLLVGGLSYVWTNTSAYGWKASSFYNKVNNPAESWLVSPAINFKKATAPLVTFEEAINYLKGAELESYCTVKISTDYKDDVTTATWTPLSFPTRSSGSSWDFVKVGEVDLTAYIGNVVRIAFVYTVPTGSTVAPTWEFKNIVVKEKVEE